MDDGCLHGDQFRITNAHNGCLACQCELEAKHKTEARLELHRAKAEKKELAQLLCRWLSIEQFPSQLEELQKETIDALDIEP